MTNKHKKHSKCANCDYKFKDADNFCPECGQKNHEIKIPLTHLIEEALGSLLHLDSKTFVTLKKLVIRPGFLSAEYNAGKRVKYVPPFRLYVMISFIFFFLINVFSGNHSNDDPENSAAAKNRINLSYQYLGISSNELSGLTIPQTDSLMQVKNIEQTNFNKWIVYQLHKISNSSSAEFSHSLMKNLTYMMFVLMPVFGLIIVGFNRKKMKFGIEGINISIHYHSFVFLLFSSMILLAKLLSPWFYLIGMLIPPIYLLIMLKRYFKEGILLTIYKSLGIGILYLISLIVLFIITVIISIMLV